MEPGKREEERPRERGLLHRWRGYSCSASPDCLLLSRPVLQAALGARHSVLLTEGGLIYSVGQLPWKQGPTSSVMEPLLETSLSGQGVVSIAAGSFHSGAVTANGAVYMWGENSDKQCGISGPSLLSDPTLVTVLDVETTPPEVVKVSSLACGARHTLALSSRHEVWSWGSGCQLGLVTSTFPVSQPQKVEHLVGRYVIQVTCGERHSLALVRNLPPPDINRSSLDRCGHCQQLLYTMIDKDDHVIISDRHYCPLGVELRQDQGSPVQRSPKAAPSPSTSLTSEVSCSGRNSSGHLLPQDPPAKEDQATSEEPSGTSINTTGTEEPVSRNRRSLYPDEDEVREYLHRLSMSEHSSVSAGPSSPVNGTLFSFCHDQQQAATMSPALLQDDSEEPDGPEPSPTCNQNCEQELLLSPVEEHLTSTQEGLFEDSGVEEALDPLTGTEINSHVPWQDEDPLGVASSLKASKTSSLSDIRPFGLEEVSWRSSLPGFISQVSPQVRAATNVTETEPILPSLYTEVWSWGQGEDGQLGHGDSLPRLQPLCIKSLSKKEVVKVAGGARHSLALTAQCQVFSWGSNKSGQLGQLSSSSTVPQQIRMSDGIRVWDVGAGNGHTLLLADGDCFQPILYYSGEQLTEEGPTGTYTQTPTLLPFCMNMGYVSGIFVGGPCCMALADQNTTGFIATLHELCASERRFYCRLGAVKSQILRPLLSWKRVRESLGPSFLLLQALAGSFSRLCHLTGQHAVSLTHFLQGGRDVRGLAVLKHSSFFLDSYREYYSSLGDFLVMGGFQALVKPSQDCFGKKLDVLRDLLEPQDEGAALGDLLLTLLFSPAQHLHQHSKMLLKLTTCFHVDTVEHQQLQDGCVMYENLALQLWKQRKEAEQTLAFWKSLPSRAAEPLRKPTRRLVRVSGNKSLTLQNAGRFSVNRFILFNDVLVHTQFSAHHVHPLATLWAEPVSDESAGAFGLKLTTPEETFTVLASSPVEKADWLRSISQAVENLLGGDPDQRAEPRMSRTARYTFVKEGRLRDAVYDGRWLCGRPHGRGTMKWPDGRVYTGMFKNGLEDGFGDHVTPNKTFNRSDRYQGHWKEGRMHGFGTYRYASGDVYEGSFQENQRHGHGMLSSGKRSCSSSVFVGHWQRDRKCGYGVHDDITRGEKYMGQWLDDQREGSGVVVTQLGLYYEGAFSSNKMMGPGLLLADDDTAYVGDLAEDWTLNGKGTLFLLNGDWMEGIFVGPWGSGLKVVATYVKAADSEKNHSRTYVLGSLAVPAELKWCAVFEECWRRLGCDSPGQGDCSRAWENIAVSLTNRPEPLSRSQHMTLESLEFIPQHSSPMSPDAYDKIRRYLTKACDTPLHPLGWLLETLVTVYRITYVGVGSSQRLLRQAVDELHSYISRFFQLLRFLFPSLPDDGAFIPEQPSAEHSFSASVDSGHSESPERGLLVSSSSLLLPVLLPRLYPPLFTLYALEREREEELYWDHVLRLNQHPDLALLDFLGVKRRFWPETISVLGEQKKVLPCTTNACFTTAVETLQQISTAFTPSDKLLLLHRTFEELTQEARLLLKQSFLWSMDDLFPLFLYVVLRARIRCLGSEVNLIEDLMDPHLQHGELGHMVTTLKACYVHIHREKVL
ncbi:alsin isoform X2 [Denticeps clupeoides]|uniref:VPS9 domain-containing protein n=1 Tax=Denticeps clupeoides TaxID=299321 RepID=A0AAY4B5T1_9TELE|nr:alsin-like isoform X2 [Denticeps clupeoides]